MEYEYTDRKEERECVLEREIECESEREKEDQKLWTGFI